MDSSAHHESDEQRDLFACLRDASLDPARRRRLRNRAVECHLKLVDYCARDLNLEPDQRDDVIQAGRIGLINAVDRFDPTRDIAFPTFARPTITGEMLRYLRDRQMTIRLPRRHRDITHAARASRDHLRRSLGHDPSTSEYAEFLRRSPAEIDAAFAAEAACSVLPLEAGSSDQRQHAPRDACRDRYLELLPERLDLRNNLAKLPAHEHRVIALHIYGELTQTEVAQRLGMSQVQVSRTLRHAIRHLREGMTP